MPISLVRAEHGAELLEALVGYLHHVVEDRRDAALERLDPRQQRPVVDHLGIERAGAGERICVEHQHLERQASVAPAEGVLLSVDVGVDQARHQQQLVGVDHLVSRAAVEMRTPTAAIAVAVDQDIGPFGPDRVPVGHRQHRRVLEQRLHRFTSP